MFLLLTCNSQRLSFLEGAFKDAWGKRKTRGGAVCQFPESFDQILILRVLCCTVSAPQMILPTQEVVQHIVVGALDALPPPTPNTHCSQVHQQLLAANFYLSAQGLCLAIGMCLVRWKLRPQVPWC